METHTHRYIRIHTHTHTHTPWLRAACRTDTISQSPHFLPPPPATLVLSFTSRYLIVGVISPEESAQPRQETLYVCVSDWAGSLQHFWMDRKPFFFQRLQQKRFCLTGTCLGRLYNNLTASSCRFQARFVNYKAVCTAGPGIGRCPQSPTAS